MSSIEKTDPIFQEVLRLFRKHGDPMTEPLKQSILMENDLFIGCRFWGTKFSIDWLAEKQLFQISDLQGSRMMTIPAQINIDTDDIDTDTNSPKLHEPEKNSHVA